MPGACTVARKTVLEVMTRDVVTVEPEDTLRDVVETLADHRVTGAPVMQGGTIVGVISRTDILEFLATTPPVPAMSGARFTEWGEFGTESEFEGDEQSTSFYTDLWEDAGTDLVERFAETDAPEWDLLSEYTASAVMTRKLELLPPDAGVTDAARRMLNGGVHRLLVASDGKLLGIVSMTDLLRALMEEEET